MEGKGTHSDECKYIETGRCSYGSVQTVIPDQGAPCHNSPEGKAIINGVENIYYLSPILTAPNVNNPNQSARELKFSPLEK